MFTVPLGVHGTSGCSWHLWVFMAPLGVHGTSGCSWHLWVFMAPLGVLGTSGCSWHLLVGTSGCLAPLGVHGTSGCSRHLWVFMTPLGVHGTFGFLNFLLYLKMLKSTALSIETEVCPLPLQLGGMAERCKLNPQKLCKFRVMKLQNNTEFQPQNAYAFQLCMRTCCSSFGLDAQLFTFSLARFSSGGGGGGLPPPPP